MKDFFDQFDWTCFLGLFALVMFGVPIVGLIISDFIGFITVVGVILGLCAITFVIYVIIWAVKKNV